MKIIAAGVLILGLSGCSLLPRPHDPVMFNQLVAVDIQVERVNCDQPNWKPALSDSRQLARYAVWRKDPQSDNLTGLEKHIERMDQGGSKTFCELGKRTAISRIQAAKTAWEGR
jgi:hypothetical protein